MPEDDENIDPLNEIERQLTIGHLGDVITNLTRDLQRNIDRSLINEMIRPVEQVRRPTPRKERKKKSTSNETLWTIAGSEITDIDVDDNGELVICVPLRYKTGINIWATVRDTNELLTLLRNPTARATVKTIRERGYIVAANWYVVKPGLTYVYPDPVQKTDEGIII